MPNAVSATRSFGIHSGLQVMSRAEGKSTKAPEVVLFTADQPFTFDWRMSSAVARALAANILQACDTADRVAAHRETAKFSKRPLDKRLDVVAARCDAAMNLSGSK